MAILKTANEYTKDQLVLLLAQARRRLLDAREALAEEGIPHAAGGAEDAAEFCELIDIAPEVPDLIGAAVEQSKFERIRNAFNDYHAYSVWCYIGNIQTQTLMQAKMPQVARDFGEACYKWLLHDVGLKPESMAMAGSEKP